MSLPSNGHLFEEYSVPVKDIVLANVGDKGDTYDDGVDTFITGEDPNNYIWYSGKLWRAVSVNNDEGTVKLVTQWNISSIPFNSSGNNHSFFEDSYIETWLNDTTVDDFLGNLRDYENFIVTDAKWNYSSDTRILGSITRPTGNNVVEDAVGLLNLYEYQMSSDDTSYANSYLKNGIYWYTLTPYASSIVRAISSYGKAVEHNIISSAGIRPSIVLKNTVKIVEGKGIEEEPYRLKGDNNKNLSGVKLNTRYSGEYIRFGIGENNLYRIVSHEITDLTKITSAEPIKNNGVFVSMKFGNNNIFSSNNNIGTFLNGTYLNTYLTVNDKDKIVTNNIWYLGNVDNGRNYILAKYADTNMSEYSPTVLSTIGLLRLGELMSGQFSVFDSNTLYWEITPTGDIGMRIVDKNGNAGYNGFEFNYGVKPALNLKSNVIITGGDGTKNDPFTLDLA